MVSETEVAAFKKNYCNENVTIGRILKAELANWVHEPILDVGCGLGDIALMAFPEKRVYLLDRLDFSNEPKSENHARLQIDFWNYKPSESDLPGTLLFSHVLQFLDDDPIRFRERLRRLQASRLVTVTNMASGVLSKIVEWADVHLESPNPERDEPELFADFRQVGEWRFEAHLGCPDFETLSEQVLYLLDIDPRRQQNLGLRGFLESQLSEPGFSIQQHVTAYSRGI